MNIILNYITSMQPEWAMVWLFIASWFNSALLGRVSLETLTKKNGKTSALGLAHVAITALILWAAFAVGFLA
jgi:hypothetical protein